MKNQLLSIIIFAMVFLVSCTNHGQLTIITELPNNLHENSGLVSLQDSSVWVVEDSGNKDELYKVGFNGKILNVLKVKNARNHDWEDLTKDSLQNVYIADTGNNKNERTNLVIYKIANPELAKKSKIMAQKIKFSYPEQSEFPPNASQLFYDAEALFHKNGKLYLITRNRSHPFTGDAFIYMVPDSPGEYNASYIARITLCEDSHTCQITAAAVSPIGDKIVALGRGKLFILSDFNWTDFQEHKLQTIDLGIRTQLESISFINDSTLLLSDERSHSTGGNLYSYVLKPKP